MRGSSAPKSQTKTRKMGIQGKMLIAVILALALIFSVLGYIVLSAAVQGLNGVTQKTIDSMAGELSGRLRISFEKSVTTGENLAKYLEELLERDLADQALVDKMVYDTLDVSNDIVTGTFAFWEPGILQDAEGETSARFLSWYHRAGTEISSKPDAASLSAYDEYYDKVRESRVLLHSEPFYTEIGEEKAICGLIINPIFLNGRFVGAVGVESRVGAFQSTVDILAESGLKVQLISTGGTIVADPDREAIMTQAKLSADILADIKAENNHSIISGKDYRVYCPLPVSGSIDPLVLCVGSSSRSAASSSLLRISAIVAGILLLVVAAAAVIFSKSIARQLLGLVFYAKKISAGDLSVSDDFSPSLRETQVLSESMEQVKDAIGLMSETLEQTSSAVLAGDLTKRADLSRFPGEYGKIMQGLNRISDAISHLVKNIKDSAASLASASTQISHGAQDLALGSTAQAASVQEISATASEIVSQARKNAESASSARELAEYVHMAAEIGKDKMNELLNALHEINEASGNIANIIKTIEDIAFQTNILALNASVEAARAGVHGKGFAVVADEVKNLAAKSAEAAKGTNALINTSISKAKGGVEIGEGLHKALFNVVDNILNAVTAIQEIDEATQQQVSSIDQLNSGIEQISNVVQNNTAAAEESASSSQELLAQAQRLNDLVAHYKVNED